MRSRSLVFILLVPFLFASNACAQVTVRFTVVPPSATPAEARVFVAGSLPVLGDWNPAGLELKQSADSLWRGAIRLPHGTSFEFKITRGTWGTQAVYQPGVVPSNFRLTAAQDTEIVIRPIQWGAGRPEAGGVTGTVRYHRGIAGEGLRYRRDLIVWLPPSYEKQPQRRFPVLYMHDGQNVFDPSTSFAGYDWRADEVADSLIRAGVIEEIIIVGITNSTDRIPEYSDTDLGKAYARFVVRNVKPFVDSTYRTKSDRENTAVMGSSMGGLISFLFTWWYPDVFSKAGCLSSVFDKRAGHVLDLVRDDNGPRRPIRIYMDCGGFGDEGSLRPGMDAMAEALRGKGYTEGTDVLRYFAPDAPHNEQAWAARLWRPMVFLFGSRGK